MYLIIFGTGEVFKRDHVTEQDMESCEAGMCTLINTETCEEFFNGTWIEIEDVNDAMNREEMD